MWLCQCECGNQTVVSSTRLLLPNGTRSCGCLRHQPSNNLVDLTGKVFGHLTVLRRDESVTGGKAKWICRCICGNTVSVFSSSLRSGKTKSCGCRSAPLKPRSDGARIWDISLYSAGSTTRRSKAKRCAGKCLCRNCGRIVQVSSYWLRISDPYGHCKCTRFHKPNQDEQD